MTYHDPGELVRAVEESWNRVAEVRLNAWWWKALDVTLTCDVGREIVEMSVEAPSLEAARTKLAELAKALALDPLPQPFYTQRSSTEYDVPGWRNERFAAALRTTIEQFVGTRAVLNEGRIVNEDGSVDAYQEVESLLRRVGNPRVFREVHIVADGPRGNALGLQLEPAEGRTVLRLRSTLTPDEFPQLTKALLRGLAVTKRAAGSTETARTNKDGSHLAKYLVPALAALLGFVLSPAFFTAASPRTPSRSPFPSRTTAPPGSPTHGSDSNGPSSTSSGSEPALPARPPRRCASSAAAR